MFEYKFWEKNILCGICKKNGLMNSHVKFALFTRGKKCFFLENLCANIECPDVHGILLSDF
jgi:hypothetical protein